MMASSGYDNRARSPSNAMSTSSVSSSMPSSPGPSVSLRTARSSTPTPLVSPSLDANHRSRDLSFSNLRNNSSSSSSSSSSIIQNRLPTRERTTSYLSSTSAAVSSSTTSNTPSRHHNRRKPTLMGGSSRLGRQQLARLGGSSTNDNQGSMPVPPILLNGAERPEDVDIGSIGKLGPASSGSMTSARTPSATVSTPELTNAGVDSLFARFGVKEVRSIAIRGRLQAEAKREELRTMVGERYRDLLGAADSIVRMKRSSDTLLQLLAQAREQCDRENMLAKAEEEDMTHSRMLTRAITPINESGHTPYSIATLVKLLLDCPEHIWRAIEREDYLSAARLEGIGRAVFRELKSSSESEGVADDGEEGDEEDTSSIQRAFPLIDQQWETLSQLGPQISQRATAHLRSWDVSATNTAEAIAAILMLDNISMPEALELLLSQRTKSLDALLEQAAQQHSTPVFKRPRARSSASAMSAHTAAIESHPNQTVQSVTHKTMEALALILTTHDHVQSLFTPDRDGAKTPQLVRLLEIIQQAPPPSSGAGYLHPMSALHPKEASPNATIHAISVNGVDTSFDAISQGHLPNILHVLPNAHLFLRYLPSTIISFTPFIDTSSAHNTLSPETAQRSLNDWFQKSITSLNEGMSRLFSLLTTAEQVAASRSALLKYLATENRSSFTSSTRLAEVSTLQRALSGSLHARFTQIYTARLYQIEKMVPEALQAALRSLSDSAEDLDPIAFIFSSSIPFPPTSSLHATLPAPAHKTAGGTSLSISTRVTTDGQTMDAMEPFLLFKQAMQNRLVGRSPVLDTCLCEVEAAARSLREDVSVCLDAPEAHEKTADGADQEIGAVPKNEYLAAVGATARKIADELSSTLSEKDSATRHEQLFIGSFALHLVHESTFVEDLSLGDESAVGAPVVDTLTQIERDSTTQWRTQAVQSAVEALVGWQTALSERPSSLDATTKPSELIFNTLYSLMTCLRELGPHRCQAAPATAHRLLSDFEGKALATIRDGLLVQLSQQPEHPRGPAAKQALVDVVFLRQVLRQADLKGQSDPYAAEWVEVQDKLAKMTSGAIDDGLGSFRRSQNLLAPLLSTAYQQSCITEQAMSDDSSSQNNRTSLLPFGHPDSASSADTKLELSKPGPRFALVPLNATAA